MNELVRIGVDLAKNVFQVHGVDRREQLGWCKRLPRLNWPAMRSKRRPLLHVMAMRRRQWTSRTSTVKSAISTVHRSSRSCLICACISVYGVGPRRAGIGVSRGGSNATCPLEVHSCASAGPLRH